MQKVKSGLEVLLEQKLGIVRGRRVGLVTNHSAVTRELSHIVDVLPAAGVKLTALYAPEHGIRGDLGNGQAVPSFRDPRTGIEVYSLYGQARKPTPEMLSPVDMVIFDVQDIGCRFYTYIYTMSYVLQACAEQRKPLIVLDRPNPINGIKVEGNTPEKQFRSFVGLHPIPMRHGMTTGELAIYFDKKYALGADLQVITCQGWKRAMWFDETGLPWVMPSPGMPTLDTALLYSGTCLLEGTNISEGRGTTKPFEIIGAPWVDGYSLADRLNSVGLPGVHFRPMFFTPIASKHAQQECGGVQAHVIDRNLFQPVVAGLYMVKAFHDLFPREFQFRPPDASGRSFFDLLAGTDKARLAIQAGAPVAEIIDLWYADLNSFMPMRQKCFLYS
jgi:uncharacterized protein YbbC (DUF1343 family)